MKNITGHFTTQPSRSFPHDCQLLENLQNMLFIPHILGNIAGDRTILYGCEKIGSRRTEGYVFIRTERHPEGEVVWFEGGTEDAGMYICYETEQVSSMGIDFEEAYTRYWLAEGSGTENFSWEDFNELFSIPQLKREIESNRSEIAAITPPPLGIAEIWAGKDIPEGYALCDGGQYLQTEFPELFRAIGTTYNSAPTYSGTGQTTAAGYFRLPDLRSRFVVGQSPESGYTIKGSAGGAKTVTLTTANIPSHTHSLDDYYYIYSGDNVEKANILSGYTKLTTQVTGAKNFDTNNDALLYRTHNTSSTGSGIAHENRPPYYTLAYIMRLK